jgi:rRNA maturation RNase YbeY
VIKSCVADKPPSRAREQAAIPRSLTVAARSKRVQGRRDAPRLLVTVTRALNAPASPGARSLRGLFTRALELAKARPGCPAWAHAAKGFARLAVDVHIVTDARIAALNLAHLKLHGPTYVLAFDIAELDPERRAFNLGAVVVSFQTARREARARGIRVEEELSRYCLHGFLHLLGYEDDSKAARAAMCRVQESLLGE